MSAFRLGDIRGGEARGGFTLSCMNRVTLRGLAATLLVLTVVSACRSDSTYPGCIGAARYGGAIYRELGFTSQDGATLKGNAAFATCEDVDRDGVSKALRDESKVVTARSVPGYRPDQVIAVQVTDKAWSVLISEDASKGLPHQIRKSGLLNAGED
jgi:hypothetical protein